MRKLRNLAKLFCILTSAGFLSAQVPFTCAVTANPSLLRAEGIAELTGDIILNCTGGTPTPAGLPVPLVNIAVMLNTDITSRLLGTAPTPLAEALLLIDSPGVGGAPLTFCIPAVAAATCPATGTGAPSTTVGGVTLPGGVRYGTQAPNIYQGRFGIGDTRQVTWSIPLDPPGPVGTRIIRLANIRANASRIGTGLNGQPNAIVAYISTTSVPLTNSRRVVGYAVPGLRFSFERLSNPLLQCESTGVEFRARFTEGFPSSFVRRAWFPGDLAANPDGTVAFVPTLRNPPPSTIGQTYTANSLSTSAPPDMQNVADQSTATETGVYFGNRAVGTPFAGVGLANSGTRLMVRFPQLPNGVQLFPGQYEAGAGESNSRVRLIATDVNGAGIAFPGEPASGGTTFVYEVVSSDPHVIETIDIPIVVAFGGNAVSTGTATVTGTLVPVSTVTTASATAPIPRFVDVSTPASAFVIEPCRTTLLFPFVTNAAGFDTGIAISNTSSDPLNTVPEAGVCRINYFGSTAGGGPAPPSQTSSVVGAGETLTFVVSSAGRNLSGTPGFQGYIIAQCEFRFAHGFAFISNGASGLATVAEGYLAVVLDGARQERIEPGRGSESLGH